jgi:hypothetical protein
MNKLFVVICVLFLNVWVGSAQINLDTASFYTLFKQQKFDGENIVAIGEAHTIRNTYGTEFFICKNLFEKGYKTIYIEFGEAEAAILNMYMTTGDSSVIKYTMSKWWNAAFYKEFLKPAYQLNKAKGYNIAFKGFDFERPISVGFLFSKWFGDAKIKDIDLKKLSNGLLAMDEFKVRKNLATLAKTMDSLKISFTENESAYKEILKDNLELFKKIIFNPVTAYNARDENFVKKILDAEKNGQLTKAIIITGNHHLLFKKNFIPVLADKLPEKYSITVFPFLYSNCLNKNGNKMYSSLKRYLKYLSGQKILTPLIKFTKPKQAIIVSRRNNVSAVLVELYNQ